MRFLQARRGKIVDGRVAKIAKERALLEQPFIKDTSKSVAEHIKAAVAAIGENIQVWNPRGLRMRGSNERSVSFSPPATAFFARVRAGVIWLGATICSASLVGVHLFTPSDAQSTPCRSMGGVAAQVRRFSRYVLGEGMEKRSTDFAAEVAAQTGQA